MWNGNNSWKSNFLSRAFSSLDFLVASHIQFSFRESAIQRFNMGDYEEKIHFIHNYVSFMKKYLNLCEINQYECTIISLP